MEIHYDQNGRDVKLNVKKGQNWSIYKNTRLASLFNEIDNGNGVVDETELDALASQMAIFDQDGKKNHITAGEQNILESRYWVDIRKKVKLAENLYNDIRETNFGIPTTGKFFGEHVYLVNQSSVTTVFRAYNEKSGGDSLIGDIMMEYGLSIDERIKYSKYLITVLAKDKKSRGINVDYIQKKLLKTLTDCKNSILPASNFYKEIAKLEKQMVEAGRDDYDYNSGTDGLNGKIDKPFSQGHVGDCYLLAGIQALAMSSQGLKILNDAVKILPNGKVQVTLKPSGIPIKYVFTKEEILKRKDLSSGDLDVRAIEMAFEKAESTINGGNAYEVYNLLAGKPARNWLIYGYSRLINMALGSEITDEQIDNFGKNGHIAVVSRSAHKSYSSNEYFQCSGGIRGSKVQLHSKHAYAVKGSDKNNVYLVNPWDTSGVITVPRKKFKEFFNHLEVCDI